MAVLRQNYCTVFSLTSINMKQTALIKFCLNETYSDVRIMKYLSDSFRIQNGLIQGDALPTLFPNFDLVRVVRMVQVN
jgi:hypothetical protein